MVRSRHSLSKNINYLKETETTKTVFKEIEHRQNATKSWRYEIFCYKKAHDLHKSKTLKCQLHGHVIVNETTDNFMGT